MWKQGQENQFYFMKRNGDKCFLAKPEILTERKFIGMQLIFRPFKILSTLLEKSYKKSQKNNFTLDGI